MTSKEKKEHDEREKLVVTFLTQSTEELSQAFSTIEGRPLINDKPKLILVFTALDIFYTYWQEYLGEKVSQKVGFPSWIDRFCFLDNNNVYQSNASLRKITSTHLYELRNSLIHFYGLRRKTDHVNIMILSDTKNKKDLDKLTKKFDQQTNEVNIILQPKLLKDLIWEGAILMMKEMIKNMEINPDRHVQGIKNIYTEVIERGTARIEFE